MKTCEDCLHREVCNGWKTSEVLQERLLSIDKCNCNYFADRSEWTHLPCEIGDIVFYFADAYYYRKDKSRWKVWPIKVTEINTKLGKNGKVYPLSIIANGTRYPLKSIGKTLFLTRKEAEEALERMKENENL